MKRRAAVGIAVLGLAAWASPRSTAAEAVAAGHFHTVAIDAAGNVWTWGYNASGQLGLGNTTSSALPVPVPSLTGVIEVAAGASHTLALKSDGTVWAWGLNSAGQLGDGSTSTRQSPVQVPGLVGVIHIAAGDSHSVAVKSDGKVWTWGYNFYNQLGDGGTLQRTSPYQVSGPTGVVAVSAGSRHTVAVGATGTVWAWGGNQEGQVGDGTTTSRTTPVALPAFASIVSVAAGSRHTLALDSVGGLWAWGDNAFAQLGSGSVTDRLSPAPVQNLENVVRIAAGQYHSLAVLADGTAWGWGYNAYGEAGTGAAICLVPSFILGLSNVSAVAAGAQEHSVAVSAAGGIWAWGYNPYGEVGDGTSEHRLSPVRIAESGFAWRVGTPVPSVRPSSYSTDQTVALTSATPLATIRFTLDGSDPSGASPIYATPLSIGATTTLKAYASKSGMPSSNVLAGTYVMKAAAPAFSPVGGTFAAAQSVSLSSTTPSATIRYTTDGTAPTAGSPAYASPLNVGTTTTLKAAAFRSGWTTSDTSSATYAMNFGTLAAPSISPAAATYVTSVSVSLTGPSGAALRYTTDGSDPTPASALYSVPFTVGVSSTVKAVAYKTDYTPSPVASGAFTIQASTPTFSLASGSYAFGQTVTLSCATPGVTIRYSLDGSDPTASHPGVSSGSAIAVGNYTLKAKAFASGIVTSGTASATYSITGGSGSGAVSAGFTHSLALKPDGTVWSWGGNTQGQLGDGSLTQRSTPVQVATLSGILKIAAGYQHSLALKSDGTVWAWGYNGSGQLGLNDATRRTLPVQIPGLSAVVAIAAGENHSLALMSDGTVSAWGANASGQLGDNTLVLKKVPGPVLNVAAVNRIAAGWNFSLAVKSDGTGRAWGLNSSWQLGDNTTTSRSLPVPIQNLSSLARLTGGLSDSLAVKTDGTAYAWGSDNGQHLPTAIAGLTGVSHIAAADNHFIALESDFSAWAWGDNAAGQLGNGTTTASASALRVAGLPALVEVAAGGNHSLALAQDGSVWAWGLNSNGQVGDGALGVNRLAPVKVAEPGFAWKVATPVASPAGGLWLQTQSVTLSSATSGASIYYTTDGTTPTPPSSPYSTPVAIDSSKTLKAIATKSGLSNSNVDTEVYTLQVATPTLSPSGGTYSVAQTVTVSCAVVGATLRYTTNGLDPTTGDPVISSGSTLGISQSQTLKVAAWKTGWTNSAVANGTYVLKVATPSLSPSGGAFAAPPSVTVSTTTPLATLRYTISGLDPTEVDAVVVSGSAIVVSGSATLKVKGFRTGWTASDTATNTYVISRGAAATPTLSPPGGTYATAQSVALSVATPGAVIRSTLDGTDPSEASPVAAASVSLGPGTTTLKARAWAADYTPSAVATGTYTIGSGAVAAPSLSVPSGRYVTSRTVTISASTPGATIHYTTNGVDPIETDPTIVSGASLVVDRATIVKAAAWKAGMTTSTVTRRDYVVTGAVSAGGTFLLALKPDGTVWGLGGNGLGQLGDTTTTNRSAPVQTASLANVVAVSAGTNHSLALQADGTVWAWGYNFNGQIGDGTTTTRTSPVQISTLSGITAISAGNAFSLAVKSNGTVWAWGLNSSAQLGDNTTTQRTSPIQVSTIASGTVAVAAGGNFSLALKSDGTLLSWGTNSYGQLGDGTTAQRKTPVPVITLAGVSAISAGSCFALAHRTSGLGPGTVWSWGCGSAGQLGDGTLSTSRLSPSLAGLRARGLDAGETHAVGLRLDGGLASWGSNNYGELGRAGGASGFALPSPAVGDVLQASAGTDFGAALVAQGVVWTWGVNTYGQLGHTGTALGLLPNFLVAQNAWLLTDSDGDGLNNAAEYRYGTDPLSADTNRDGVSDAIEISAGLDPLSRDSDGDGLINELEQARGTNPFAADSDGDGTADGADCYPLDPSQTQCGTPNSSDHTGPLITIVEPPNAVPLP